MVEKQRTNPPLADKTNGRKKKRNSSNEKKEPPIRKKCALTHTNNDIKKTPFKRVFIAQCSW